MSKEIKVVEATTKKDVVMKSITYKVFAEWTIALCNDEEIEGYNKEIYVAKAEKLLAREEKRAKTSRENAKPAVSTASESTRKLASDIEKLLLSGPHSISEINYKLDTNHDPLLISNAVLFLSRTVDVFKGSQIETSQRKLGDSKYDVPSLKVVYFLESVSNGMAIEGQVGVRANTKNAEDTEDIEEA